MPKLRHIALHTTDPDRTAEFFKRVFEMVEVGRTNSPYAEGVYLSDGDINLALLRFKSAEAADRGDGLGPVLGLHHFGFWVEDIVEARQRLANNGAEHREDRLPQAITSNFEEKWIGPEGVLIDISQSGWVGARPPKD